MKFKSIVVSMCLALALLTGSLPVVSGETRFPAAPADATIIIRAYYPDLTTGNRVLMAFEPQMLETNYTAGYHVMQVTLDEIAQLESLGLKVVRDSTWSAPAVGPALGAEVQSIPGYSCYRTVEETFASAQALATAHPNLATWTDAGDSWEKSAGLGGYDMMVLELTNTAIAGDKPRLLVTSSIHAREYATAELAMRFAEYLVGNYGVDADATWLLDYHEVHLMLYVNPDGRKKAETGLSWRKNTNQNYCGATSSNRGADLNRNYAFQWDCCGGSSDYPCNQTYHGAAPGSEPEIQAVQSYMATLFPDQRGPNLTDAAPLDATGVYIDLHSYGRLILSPWGFTRTAPANGAGLQTLGRKWAYYNGYTPQPAIDLYVTDGASKDYAYGVFGVPGYTWELGTAFFQDCAYFENTLLPGNLPALIYAAKAARTPYMTPSGPDAISLALGASRVEAGTPVILSASIDDTRYNNSNGTEATQNIAAAECYVDAPPWVAGAVALTMSAADGSYDAKSEAVTATIDTTGLTAGRHIVFVRGQDAAGNWGAFSALFLNVEAPTAVDLLSFTARGLDNAVALRWVTANELDVAGFNLYRARWPKGPQTALNAEPIASLVAPGSQEGALYRYRDAGLRDDTRYYYWLEIVDLSGRRSKHGPIGVVTK